MRVWEFERYGWGALEALGSARGVPAALDALSSSSTDEEARKAFWRIDNCVVVQGTPHEAAAATAACVVVLLPICSSVARPLLLELLDQVTSGDPVITPAALQDAIFNEVVKAYAWYVSLAQHGADVERSMCIDLLLYCARYDPDLRRRTEYYLERVSRDETATDMVRAYAASRLKFDKANW
jgi:hypothetical protein